MAIYKESFSFSVCCRCFALFPYSHVIWVLPALLFIFYITIPLHLVDERSALSLFVEHLHSLVEYSVHLPIQCATRQRSLFGPISELFPLSLAHHNCNYLPLFRHYLFSVFLGSIILLILTDLRAQSASDFMTLMFFPKYTGCSQLTSLSSHSMWRILFMS